MGKYLEALRMIAHDRSLEPAVAEKLMEAEAKDWEEGKHPRDKSGKFTSGSGGGGGEKSSSSEGSTVQETVKSIKSPKDLKGRKITLEGEKGRKTVITGESKEHPGEYEVEHYNAYSATPVKGSMNQKALENELKRADPSKTKIEEAGGGENSLTKEQMEMLNAGRKAFNKMHGLPENAEAYPAGGKPLSELIGKEYLKAGEQTKHETPKPKGGHEELMNTSREMVQAMEDAPYGTSFEIENGNIREVYTKNYKPGSADGWTKTAYVNGKKMRSMGGYESIGTYASDLVLHWQKTGQDPSGAIGNPNGFKKG